jgi:hypothetical protein
MGEATSEATTMRIRQVTGHYLMPDVARKRLEESVFGSGEEALRNVQEVFPNHVVYEEANSLRVAVRDRSFQVAEFVKL